MTENKRFTELMNLDYNIICDSENNKSLNTEEIVELLNELYKEKERVYKQNIRIVQTITEFYKTERTAIGKSVLKQLIEAI